ncbi:endonuclease domain-containing protein [Halomicronema sp. CCY15110]|uniref:endonuclease domain-containing protein n=1 Tax=Halomicronema sp. CCY15110 TaxID=2767773 RepID=UPI001951B053|nr:endonuclease domain-containing protein [Halomicronema sp. CCY15110]
MSRVETRLRNNCACPLINVLKPYKHRVLRQHPIHHFIVDFYCHSLKLVIEVKGDSHFVEMAQAYDERRTLISESYGLQVLRFTNQQVLHDFEAVYMEIEALSDVQA